MTKPIVIEAMIETTAAEETIAWFCSGAKQEKSVSTLRVKTPCNGVENDSYNLQRALDFASRNGGTVYLPPATLAISGCIDGRHVPCMVNEKNDGYTFMMKEASN